MTQKTYKIKSHCSENILCCSQNLIYILTCKNCNIQYVGETVLPVNKRINIHRKAKSGCERVIKHFRNDSARSSIIIQIFELFPGTGYKNNKVCAVELAKRLKIEDYWMKTLRTIYPYGLIKRARQYDSEVPVGKLFFSIPRTN